MVSNGELLPLPISRLKTVGSDSNFSDMRTERRNSMFDKLMHSKRAHAYLSSARSRAFTALTLLAVLVLLAGGKRVYDQASLLMNRLWVKLPGSDEQPLKFPSLNLFDYEPAVSFPVFRDVYPLGLQRAQMPQLPERVAAKKKKNSTLEHDANKFVDPVVLQGKRQHPFWIKFEALVEASGGHFSEDDTDLRFTRPLQREISGLIVYNVLFKNIKARLERDPHLFRDHIVLVETPEDMVGRMGERIPAGTLFNLDGHHTNQVLKLCAKIMHPNLRRGNINMEHHVCGSLFNTHQKVLVIKQLHPLHAISLALEAGAESGHGMTIFKEKKHDNLDDA